MIKKCIHVQSSIRSSKQTLKSVHKKPTHNNYSYNNSLSHPQPIPENQKKRTNSSYIQNSNKNKIQQAGYSHKKYNSNSSFKNNKHKIFQVEHMLPSSFGPKISQKQTHPKVYSSITAKHESSVPKKKIRKNFKNNESVGEIGYCKKVITQKPKAMSSYNAKQNNKGQIDESPIRKQDNIKTDLDQHNQGKQNLQHNSNSKNEQKQSFKQEQQQQLSKLANIDVQELKKIDQMTSKHISQLQSRSQTIDLLKFTIKTKLQKDLSSQSPYMLNSLISSHQKAPNQQYIEQILRLKQLQTNFYVQKITTLQNQLNKYRKESQRYENQVDVKYQQQSRKVLVDKSRLQEENTLLKRQNQALRTIIMKKIKNNQKTKHTQSHAISQSVINDD